MQSTIYKSEITKTSLFAAESPYPERRKKRDKPVEENWIASHHAKTAHFLEYKQVGDDHDPMDDLILGSLKPNALRRMEANNKSIIRAMQLKKQ